MKDNKISKFNFALGLFLIFMHSILLIKYDSNTGFIMPAISLFSLLWGILLITFEVSK